MEKKGLIKKFFLARLFGKQIKILKDRGCPGRIITTLQNQKIAVIKKASEMTFEFGHIPFLPVMSLKSYDVSKLMAMIEYSGHTSLSQARILDLETVPKEAESYYIYDVEDGETTRGKLPYIVGKTFAQQKRFPLTVAEIVSLCIQSPAACWRYGMWALGSNYVPADYVPDDPLLHPYLISLLITADFSGRPILIYDRFYTADYALKNSPSCGSR